MHVALYVTARGLTTSPIPYGERVFQIDFDFIDHALRIETSDGPRSFLIPILIVIATRRRRRAPAEYLVTEMLCWAAGGPQKYTGRGMITAAEWEAFLDDLRQTLDKSAVPEAEQAEIKAIIGSTRADIVL